MCPSRMVSGMIITSVCFTGNHTAVLYTETFSVAHVTVPNDRVTDDELEWTIPYGKTGFGGFSLLSLYQCSIRRSKYNR
jgi:hypothetical protein